jgi:RHS repeat-associated protein
LAHRAQNGETFFEHQDWTGTERMRTNYQGAVATSDVSLAFGDGYSETVYQSYADQETLHYAGLDHDTESSTEHAQFRQYSSTQGRWLSPDPFAGSYRPANPQSYNRYVYALNNPFGFIDPSGLESSDCDNEACAATVEQCDDLFSQGCLDAQFPLTAELIADVSDITLETLDLGGGPTPEGIIDPIIGNYGVVNPVGPGAPINAPTATTPCSVKIQNALNNIYGGSQYLGPTIWLPNQQPGYRNGAYNYDFFLPGVTNPYSVNNGQNRFGNPYNGLHIVLPGGSDPVLPAWGQGTLRRAQDV